MIGVKRAYEEASTSDGFRILVDKYWPRGLSKQRARIDLWLREISPSDQLRKWYSHDPRKWESFQKKYADELLAKKALLDKVREIERTKGRVTLLFSSKEQRYNNAVALASLLGIKE